MCTRFWRMAGSVSLVMGVLFGAVRPVGAQTSGDTAFWTSATTLGNDPVPFNALGYGVNPGNSGAANLAALNSLVAACNAIASGSGCRIYVPPGKYTVTGSVNPFTSPVTMYGAAGAQLVSAGLVGGAVFDETTSSATLFDFQNVAIVSDLSFSNGTTALKFDRTTSPLIAQSGIIRCTFAGQLGVVVIMQNQGWYVIRDSVWTASNYASSSYVALEISAPLSPDTDQGTITGNVFNVANQAFAGIHWLSGGGTRIVNNKFLTSHINTTAILIDPAAHVHTSDIFITNNSIEGSGKFGIYLAAANIDTEVYNFVINDNQFGGFVFAQIQSNSTHIHNVSIVGNVFFAIPSATNVGIALVEVSGAIVSDNIFDGVNPNVVATYVASAASDVTIGPNTYTTVVSQLAGGNTTTKVKGLTESTFASLPTTADGSMMFCSDCVVAATCAGGGTGSFAKHLNGAWVCN